MSEVIEMQREMESKGISFIVLGCRVDIQPPEDRSLTINEIAEIFDEAKRMAIKMHSMNLVGGA